MTIFLSLSSNSDGGHFLSAEALRVTLLARIIRRLQSPQAFVKGPQGRLSGEETCWQFPLHFHSTWET